MQIITIDKQQFVAISQVAIALNLSIQRIHELIKDRKLKVYKLNKHSSAISLEDFELIKITRVNGRPKTRKK